MLIGRTYKIETRTRRVRPGFVEDYDVAVYRWMLFGLTIWKFEKPL